MWDELANQPKAGSLLESSARHPAHAYLFVGATSTIKGEAAKRFAAAVICETACGECQVCSRILRGLHPDVSVAQPEGQTYAVEVIRQLVSSSAQSPIEAPRRVFVIEEAHRIVEKSQNSLLKALEEPNPSVVWILLADSVHQFLTTIVSRCQVIEFAGLNDRALTAMLVKSTGVTELEAADFARFSGGDSDRALRLAAGEPVRTLRREAIAAATEARPTARWALGCAERVQALGATSRLERERLNEAELAEFAEFMGAGRGSAGGRKVIADRHKRQLRRADVEIYEDFLYWLGIGFRDLAAARLGAPEDIIVSSDSTEAILRAAPNRDSAFWLGMVEECLAGQIAMRDNSSPSLVLEATLLNFIATPAIAS